MSAAAEIVVSPTPAEAAARLAAELRAKPWRPLIDALVDGTRITYRRSTVDHRVIWGQITIGHRNPRTCQLQLTMSTYVFVADGIVTYELGELPTLAGSPPSFRSIEDIAAAVVVHDLARTAGGRP